MSEAEASRSAALRANALDGPAKLPGSRNSVATPENHDLQVPLPCVAGGFPGLVADPAYLFRVWSERGNGRSPKYPRLPPAEIMELPVASIAARDAWLFLWTTGPHWPQALEIIKAWGFRYSAIGFTWIKLRRKLSGADLIRADFDRVSPAPWHGLHDAEECRVLPAGEARESAPADERRPRDHRSARSRALPKTG